MQDSMLLLGKEALPSIGNTLWHIWTVFTRSAITTEEVTDLDEIWDTPVLLLVHCLELALADFGRNPRRSKSDGATKIFFLVW